MWIKTEQDQKLLIFLKSQSKWNALCDILLPWFALLKVRSSTSPKIWVELWVLIQKYFISFFKKASRLGYVWINRGSSKHARMDPSNLKKKEELWELCQHPTCAHVLPFYLNSKGMLMGCRIPLKESHSPARNQGNFCFCPHRSTVGIQSLTSAAGVRTDIFSHWYK